MRTLTIIFTQGSFWIVVRESVEPDALFPLLHQNTTADMNAITAHQIISVYPRSTLERKGFYNERLGDRSFFADQNPTYARHSVDIRNVGDHIEQACEAECGYLWRNTYSTTGPQPLQFTWKEESTNDFAITTFPPPVYGIAHHHYKWRLGYMCTNYWCPRYRLPHAPSGAHNWPPIFNHTFGASPSYPINRMSFNYPEKCPD